jgi:hypothetical protein
MKFIYFFSLLSLFCLVSGYQDRRQSTGNGTTTLNSTENGSPCAIVSQIAAAATCMYAPGLETSEVLIFGVALPTVDAQLAYECLTSVPINSTDATALINSILPYVEWQTGNHPFLSFTTISRN